MSLELIPARPEHLADLGRICHLAFNTLHERHRVHQDMPEEEVGRAVIGVVLNRKDCAGVVALENGRVVGSNFLALADVVCGVGPITVHPDVQSRGVGRVLMKWVIDEAHRQRGKQVDLRLFQEAVNATSLSLYTRLGFHWRDSAAQMFPKPAESDDASVRAMTTSDLPEIARLSTRHYGFSRAKDAEQLLKMEMPAFVRERGGRVVAYQIVTLYGHASGETIEDLIVLASQVARKVPPPLSVIIVPMSQSALFAAALSAGHRVGKVLNYMSLEPLRPMPGPTLPSILC